MGRELQPLGEFEQMVLLAVLCAGQDEDAYGVNIHSELETRTKRRASRGAVYMTLDRLEKKGLLESHLTDPTPERGGRAKRYFTVTPRGVHAVARAQRAFQRLMKGLVLPGGARA